MANSNSSLTPRSIRESFDQIASTFQSNPELFKMLSRLQEGVVAIQDNNEKVLAQLKENNLMIQQVLLNLDDSRQEKMSQCLSAICELQSLFLRVPNSFDECQEVSKHLDSSSKSQFFNNCCCFLSDEFREIIPKIFLPIVYDCYVAEQIKERLQYLAKIQVEVIKHYSFPC